MQQGKFPYLRAEVCPERAEGGRQHPVQGPVAGHAVQGGHGQQLLRLPLLLLRVMEDNDVLVPVLGVREHHLALQAGLARRDAVSRRRPLLRQAPFVQQHFGGLFCVVARPGVDVHDLGLPMHAVLQSLDTWRSLAHA